MKIAKRAVQKNFIVNFGRYNGKEQEELIKSENYSEWKKMIYGGYQQANLKKLKWY